MTHVGPAFTKSYLAHNVACFGARRNFTEQDYQLGELRVFLFLRSSTLLPIQLNARHLSSIELTLDRCRRRGGNFKATLGESLVFPWLSTFCHDMDYDIYFHIRLMAYNIHV